MQAPGSHWKGWPMGRAPSHLSRRHASPSSCVRRGVVDGGRNVTEEGTIGRARSRWRRARATMRPATRLEPAA